MRADLVTSWVPCLPADLIATTDPAAITEHGQFYRDEADCQVRWVAAQRTSAEAAGRAVAGQKKAARAGGDATVPTALQQLG